MKYMFFTSVLLLFTACLTAQTGLYDLSFGSDFTVCDSILRAKGLSCSYSENYASEIVKSDAAFVYYPTESYPEDDHLARVNLYFKKNNPYLHGWVAYYYTSKEPEISSRLISLLQATHDNQLTGSGASFKLEFADGRYLETGPSSDLYYVWYNTRDK